MSEEVDEKILHAAFVPFGDVTDINIPLDYETGRAKIKIIFVSPYPTNPKKFYCNFSYKIIFIISSPEPKAHKVSL